MFHSGVLGVLIVGHQAHCKCNTESMMNGKCNARPGVTYPAVEHYCCLAGTKLYCLCQAQV